jgi:hypothetical protein
MSAPTLATLRERAAAGDYFAQEALARGAQARKLFGHALNANGLVIGAA